MPTYQITEKGVNGPDGRIPVGKLIEIEGDLPGLLVGKCKLVPQAGQAVINPEGGGPVPPGEERQAVLMAVCIDHLGDDDFTDAGVPEVRKINAVLAEVEGDHAPFDAAERDALWSGIAAKVEAERAAA